MTPIKFHSLLKDAKKLGELTSLINNVKDPSLFDSHNCSKAIQKLSELKPKKETPEYLKSLERILLRIEKEKLSRIQIGVICFFIAENRLDLVNKNCSRLAIDLFNQIQNDFNTFPPQVITNIMKSVAILSSEHRLQSMINLITARKNLKNFPETCLENLVKSMEIGKVYDEKLIDMIIKEIKLRGWNKFNNRNITNILGGFAEMRVRDEIIISSCLKSVRKRIDDFKPDMLFSLQHSFAVYQIDLYEERDVNHV